MDINNLDNFDDQGNCPAPDAFRKRSFPEIFLKEGEGEWLRFQMDDAYFDAAMILLRNIIDGRDYEPHYGPTVLYLIRHYLEIKLKLVCFHARWLRKAGWLSNADDDEITGTAKKHELDALCSEMCREVDARMDKRFRDAIDIVYVRRLVEELDRLDHDGERFRYSVEQIKIHSTPVRQYQLRVDWPELLDALEH
jgi:hypothetical protein